LDQSSQLVAHFQQTLSVDEQWRASRFYFRQDRERFVVSRGVLRAILGRYLDRSPEHLAFIYSSYGKPSLVTETGEEAIRFNISHSHGTALYVVTRSGEIGVDLELVRDGLSVEQIAENFFSRQENFELLSLPVELRKRAFFVCWTRKEAYIKARGAGLSLPLNQFRVSLIPGAKAELLSTQPTDEALRWSLSELTLPQGYVAAFAVEGSALSQSCWRWPQPPQGGV
jgi:4'-phosphopantetheinyl transferase